MNDLRLWDIQSPLGLVEVDQQRAEGDQLIYSVRCGAFRDEEISISLEETRYMMNPRELVEREVFQIVRRVVKEWQDNA